MSTTVRRFQTRHYQRIDATMLEAVLGAREPEAIEQRSAFRLPGDISPLTQWRHAFPNIPALAENIAVRGLINPLIVAVFTRAECERYITAVNLLWGTTHSIEELAVSTLDGQPHYRILIAGERRLRACQRLWDLGCETCRRDNDNEATGTCFHRHLPEGIKVDERIGMTPFAALSLQYAENNYEPPNYDEQATGYKLYYELLRVLNNQLTVAEFSRVVGRNPTTIRRMLRYCELPESLRVLVRDGEMHFSLALLFDRYTELMYNERELAYWIRVATEEHLSVETLRKRMKAELQVRKGQTTMFGQEQLLDMQERHRRRALDTTIASFLARFEGFLAHTLRRYHDGGLGEAHSPFAQGGVVNAVLGIYAFLTLLVPHMNRAMTAKQKAQMHSNRALLDPEIEKLKQHDKRQI